MTPIERAARALARFSVRDESQFPYISKSEAERSWPAFEPQARAVLQAIREPSEAMLQAGEAHMDEVAPNEPVDLIWKDMIDAVLKE